MDSLDEKVFFKMTGSKAFHKVLGSVLKAKELGFEVKVNAVLMKGINDHEIEDFVDFRANIKSRSDFWN